MLKHGPLHIQFFNDPIFWENGYLLRFDDQPECWIIDPGLPPQADNFTGAIRMQNLQPQGILLTHCHGDHIAGVRPLQERFSGLPLLAPRDEVHMLTDAEANLSAPFGAPIVAAAPNRVLAPGDEIETGAHRWHVLDVAGHSPGGLAFYCATLGVAFVGDAVFAEGIGRTDFPGCDHRRLLTNIRDRLLSLPPETMLYSGHGPRATVAQIRQYNFFLHSELRRCGLV